MDRRERGRGGGARWDFLVVLLVAALVGLPYVRLAYFNLDDYRFLAQLQRIDAGASGALADSLGVENRWDASWWIEDGTFVRFFRPLHVPSCALDRALFGLDARGFVATNVALHAVASVLVWALLRSLLRARLPALLGGLAFAAHACRAESLHFIAGRQGTLAAIAFVGALWIHARARPGTLRAAAVGAAFFLALCAKEWALLLPVALLLHDLWLRGRDRPREPLAARLRQGRTTWIACLLAFVAYAAWRHMELSEGGSGSRPFPYFHLPGREGFGARTLAVFCQYACALAVGTPVRPFLSDPHWLVEHRSRIELAGGSLVFAAVVLFSLRRREGRWLLVLLFGALIPVLCVYSSGRYLILPAAAWCGMLGFLLRELRGLRARAARLVCGALVLLLAALPAVRHVQVLRALPTADPSRETRPERLLSMVRAAGLPIEGDRPIYLVDFPGVWIETQFLSDVLAVELGRDSAPVHVLAELPFEPAPLARVRRVAPSSIEIDRDGQPLHSGDPELDFDPRAVRAGERLSESGYSVRVLAVLDGRPTRILVTFDRPLEDVVLARGVFDPVADAWGLEVFDP